MPGSGSPTLALWSLRQFPEQVYTTLRVKPDTEPIRCTLVQCHALSATVVSCHVDLIDRFPSRSLLDLVDHILEFNCSDVTTEEHVLSFDFFPVVAPQAPGRSRSISQSTTVSLSCPSNSLGAAQLSRCRVSGATGGKD